MRHTGILAITLATVMLLAAFGCSTTSSGPSDTELIGAALTTWKEASVAKDVDKIMSVISEDFKHEGYDYRAKGKEDMRAFIEDAVSAGNFGDLEISYDPQAITIDADTAQVPGIEWSCTPGTAILGLTLKKENGAWRIIDVSVREM